MEEESVSSVIYYVVIAVITIVSLVVSSRKKKQKQQQQQANVPRPVQAEVFPDISDNAEDFFPRKTLKQSIDEALAGLSNEEKSEDKVIINDYSKYDEVKDGHTLLTRKKKEIIVPIAEPDTQHEEFDPVKAIIYSEIINKKY